MPGSDTLHLQILGGIASQLKNLQMKYVNIELVWITSLYVSFFSGLFSTSLCSKPFHKIYLSGQVFKDGSRVNGSGSSDTSMWSSSVLQVTMDTSDGELKTGTSWSWNGLGLCLSRVFSGFASCHCNILSLKSKGCFGQNGDILEQDEIWYLSTLSHKTFTLGLIVQK